MNRQLSWTLLSTPSEIFSQVVHVWVGQARTQRAKKLIRFNMLNSVLFAWGSVLGLPKTSLPKFGNIFLFWPRGRQAGCDGAGTHTRRITKRFLLTPLPYHERASMRTSKNNAQIPITWTNYIFSTFAIFATNLNSQKISSPRAKTSPKRRAAIAILSWTAFALAQSGDGRTAKISALMKKKPYPDVRSCSWGGASCIQHLLFP